MATPIAFNDTLIPFNEFILSESIRPKKVSYGVNSIINDEKILYLKALNHYITFMKYKDELYLVALDKNNEFSFGALKNNRYTTEDGIDIEAIINDISDNPKNIGAPAIKVFSGILYIMLEMVKKYKLNHFFFSSANDKLSPVYDKLIKNKYFIEDLKTQDISFKNKKDTEYYFTKTNKNTKEK